LSSHTGNETLKGLEKEIRAAIRGVSDFFRINNDGKKITVTPHDENRKAARLRDGKCLIFTTNFEKSTAEIISTYFGKDIIGVEDSLDELGRIRKTTLDFGGERRDKISVLTKEQKELF